MWKISGLCENTDIIYSLNVWTSQTLAALSFDLDDFLKFQEF